MKGYEYKNWMTKLERQQFIKNIVDQGSVDPEKWLIKDHKNFEEFIGYLIENNIPFKWSISYQRSSYWFLISQRTEPLEETLPVFTIGEWLKTQEQPIKPERTFTKEDMRLAFREGNELLNSNHYKIDDIFEEWIKQNY